jgi:hypothetical protein
MDLMKLTKQELLVKCEELGITRCKSKTKVELVNLINNGANVKDETKEELDNTQGKGSGTDSPFGRLSSHTVGCVASEGCLASRHPEGGRLTVGLPEGKGSGTDLHKRQLLTEKGKGKGQGKTVGFPFIDLFCGIGGFHQALNRLNGTCVFACDIDEKCRETYEKNYGLKPHADITKVNIAEIPDFDVLCAGFPCQAFSNSGKKKGFDDKRGRLYEYILDIAAAKRPRFLFLENVKHIKTIDDGKVFEEIMRRIGETGYTAHITELSRACRSSASASYSPVFATTSMTRQNPWNSPCQKSPSM